MATCNDCSHHIICSVMAKVDEEVAREMYMVNFWESTARCPDFDPIEKGGDKNEKDS